MEQFDPSLSVSIVVPVYKGRAFIAALRDRVKAALDGAGLTWELILVDDACPENSWELIAYVAKQEARVRGVRLSRNFGQQKAIGAGLAHSRGAWVVVMDCDLQDSPEEIPNLFQRAQSGSFDVVQGRREDRQDSALKRLSSWSFHAVLGFLTGTKSDAAVGNFGIYRRSVIEAVEAMGESTKNFPLQLRWVGFRAGTLDVAHAPRSSGRSSYSLAKLIGLALEAILAFSDRPLRYVVQLGFMLASSAILFALFLFLLAISGRFTVPGWSSVIISLWFFSGINISVLGIVGLYVGKIHEQVKRRPSFLVAERTLPLT